MSSQVENYKNHFDYTRFYGMKKQKIYEIKKFQKSILIVMQNLEPQQPLSTSYKNPEQKSQWRSST